MDVFRFNPRNSDDTFGEFFSSPFGGGMSGGMMGGSRFGSMFGNDVFSSFWEGSMRENPRKASPIEYKLPCSLEELYKGTTKKMKSSRVNLDAGRRTMPIEEILTIDIKPGWKKGTKITFPGKGNEHPNIIPADLVFVIDEKPHSVFTRDGNDLVVTQRTSLAEAL